MTRVLFEVSISPLLADSIASRNILRTVVSSQASDWGHGQIPGEVGVVTLVVEGIVGTAGTFGMAGVDGIAGAIGAGGFVGVDGTSEAIGVAGMVGIAGVGGIAGIEGIGGVTAGDG